jgi:amino acid adenylation domain-containing protein
MAADPDARLSSIDLLDETERRQVLEVWNDEVRHDYPADGRIHQLFEAQVARTPYAVALTDHGRDWTYAELNARANQLAHRLRAMGVQPDTRVAICMRRRAELVAAILGVLKSGGAYVPLDPAYPAGRIAFMLEDTAAPILLTESAVSGALPEHGARTLLLDDWSELRGEPRHDLEPVGTPENLSHVIYTSGSTGRPKGVQIQHSSTVVLLHWGREAYRAEDLGASLFATSVCFDVSVAEMFIPLSWGGRIILAENALELAEMEDAGVRLAGMVPSAAAELLRMGGIPSSVRTLHLAGEPLKNSLAQALYASTRADRVANLYGPTEDTTFSTWCVVEPGSERPVTVGRGVWNTQAYVLDATGAPAPVGVVGELLLAGEGLARGYLERPGMTAEKWIPNPFSATPGGRMYRTGDLARWLPDGELECVGRIDQQVKVRGFRIELGEIEAALEALEGVAEAVVTARDDESGEKRLVAYVVPAGSEAPSAAELKAAVQHRVPEYMVPSFFVTLDALPLSPNGKVDRKALPAPDAASSSADEYVAPRTADEIALAAIWSEVLGVERVGVYDSFFELGGHSLLATRVASRMRPRWAWRFRCARCSRRPCWASWPRTPAGCAARVRARALPAGVPVAALGPLPLSFSQARLWFLDLLEGGRARRTTSRSRCASPARWTCGAGARAGRGGRAPRGAPHHLRRDRRRAGAGRRPRGASSPCRWSTFALEAPSAPPRRASGCGRKRRRRSTWKPGPLFRASLLRMGADEHVLLITVHHIVSDGWSMGVLFSELSALYNAFAAASRRR